MCFVASILFVHVKPVKHTESAKDPNIYIIFLLTHTYAFKILLATILFHFLLSMEDKKNIIELCNFFPLKLFQF